ncbi:hypothetical protein BDW67DRAFT_151756 [Aspergillus spinulosporus]
MHHLLSREVYQRTRLSRAGCCMLRTWLSWSSASSAKAQSPNMMEIGSTLRYSLPASLDHNNNTNSVAMAMTL